jgi:hypothetical protein
LSKLPKIESRISAGTAHNLAGVQAVVGMAGQVDLPRALGLREGGQRHMELLDGVVGGTTWRTVITSWVGRASRVTRNVTDRS